MQMSHDVKDDDSSPGEHPHLPELNISGPAMKALGPLIGVYCFQYHDAYRLCKIAGRDNPALCVEVGRLVRECTRQIFHDVYKFGCDKHFMQYASCLNGNSLRLYKCRAEREKFETCFYTAFPFSPPVKE